MRHPLKALILTLALVNTVKAPLLHGQTPQTVPSQELRLGVMAPLTGDYASAGEEIARGITLAQEQLRTEDISVKISFENACLPAQGVSALRKMIDQDEIEALASNYCVITLNAIRPIIEKQGLITFQNSSVPAELIGSSPFIFSTWPTIEQEVTAIARAAGDPTLRRSGLIFLESPWGIGYADAFRNTLAKRGFTPAIDSSQAFDVHDFRTEVTRLQATKSTAILAAHTGAVMVSFLKQAKAMNISGDSIFVPSDNDDQAIVNAAGPAAEGISLFSTEAPEATTVRTQYRDHYYKRYNREPDPLSRHAYDELLLLARAMNACKKDVTCTQARISSTENFAGASGTFSMTTQRFPNRTLYRKQVKNGAFMH